MGDAENCVETAILVAGDCMKLFKAISSVTVVCKATKEAHAMDE